MSGNAGGVAGVFVGTQTCRMDSNNDWNVNKQFHATTRANNTCTYIRHSCTERISTIRATSTVHATETRAIVIMDAT